MPTHPHPHTHTRARDAPHPRGDITDTLQSDEAAEGGVRRGDLVRGGERVRRGDLVRGGERVRRGDLVRGDATRLPCTVEGLFFFGVRGTGTAMRMPHFSGLPKG